MHSKGLFTVSITINSAVKYMGRCSDQQTHVAPRLMLF